MSFVSSKDIQKARQSAKRARASAACFRCKTAKVKCSDYRPCKRCLSIKKTCLWQDTISKAEDDRHVLLQQRGSNLIGNTDVESKRISGPIIESKNQRDSVLKDQNMVGLDNCFRPYIPNHSQNNQQSSPPDLPTIRMAFSVFSGQTTTIHRSEAITHATALLPSVMQTNVVIPTPILPQSIATLLGSSRSSLLYPSPPYFDPTGLVLAPLNFANPNATLPHSF